jgi:hypothetical protein
MPEQMKSAAIHWAESAQKTPARSRLRGAHHLAVVEPGSHQPVSQIPKEFGQRIMESLMAQGYRESADEDRRLAEADMAAGFETLPD